jgi:excisionase family DNA binding protein
VIHARTIPGFLSVSETAGQLHLAARSVRDLIYAGRLPSVRMGRRHYLRAADVDQERRRRLGLVRPSARRSRPARVRPDRRSTAAPRPLLAMVPPTPESLTADSLTPDAPDSLLFDSPPAASAAPTAHRPVVRHPISEAARRARAERARERAALRERYLRSGHRLEAPALPFTVASASEPTRCAACGRSLRPSSRVVLAPAVGEPTPGAAADRALERAAQTLCLTCGRRALVLWADERRAEAAAARDLSRSLGSASPTSAAA